MLGLILTIAVVGFIVWAIITYIPMPQPFQGVIILVAILIIVFALFGGGELGGLSGCGTGLGFHRALL
jgi:hypothetical protein